MTDTRELVDELRHSANCHFAGHPLARRVTGEQLSKAADTITALSERVRVLEDALRPFAFFDNSDPNDSTQKAWEQVFQDRIQDWIEYEEIDRARAALTSGGRG